MIVAIVFFLPQRPMNPKVPINTTIGAGNRATGSSPKMPTKLNALTLTTLA
tara:strand:+ start:448 stop:600 length:153 start_codon:yes stop_codon:yes gene_type:complete